MRKLDLISGIVLFFFALALSFETRNLAISGSMGPQEGFFPLVLSILLGCFALIIMFNARSRIAPTTTPKILGPRKRKLLFYLISFLLFGVVLSWLGYTLTMVLYLLFILRSVERRAWRLTLITVLFSVIVSYFLFVRFLGITLPEGVLTPVADFLREAGMKGGA